MPAYKSKTQRHEAGRGYPKLSWATLSRLTQRDAISVPASCGRLATAARQPTGSIINCKYPPKKVHHEPDRNANKTECDKKRPVCPATVIEQKKDSLVYSEFELSQAIGDIRLALTVPVHKLESDSRKAKPLFQATVFGYGSKVNPCNSYSSGSLTSSSSRTSFTPYSSSYNNVFSSTSSFTSLSPLTNQYPSPEINQSLNQAHSNYFTNLSRINQQYSNYFANCDAANFNRRYDNIVSGPRFKDFGYPLRGQRIYNGGRESMYSFNDLDDISLNFPSDFYEDDVPKYVKPTSPKCISNIKHTSRLDKEEDNLIKTHDTRGIYNKYSVSSYEDAALSSVDIKIDSLNNRAKSHEEYPSSEENCDVESEENCNTEAASVNLKGGTSTPLNSYGKETNEDEQLQSNLTPNTTLPSWQHALHAIDDTKGETPLYATIPVASRSPTDLSHVPDLDGDSDSTVDIRSFGSVINDPSHCPVINGKKKKYRIVKDFEYYDQLSPRSGHLSPCVNHLSSPVDNTSNVRKSSTSSSNKSCHRKNRKKMTSAPKMPHCDQKPPPVADTQNRYLLPPKKESINNSSTTDESSPSSPTPDVKPYVPRARVFKRRSMSPSHRWARSSVYFNNIDSKMKVSQTTTNKSKNIFECDSTEKNNWSWVTSPEGIHGSLKGDRSNKKANNARIGGSASPLNSGSTVSSSPSPRNSTNSLKKDPKTRKLLKTNLKEGNKNYHSLSTHSPSANKSPAGSREIRGSSPAALHNRTPLKTASVSPAPPFRTSPHPTSLTRFGFRGNYPKIKNGDSTDSVNSILSDAQISDSNSNISDICDVDNGRTTKKVEPVYINNNLHIPQPAKSPTISQASSGVTSSALNKCLKAHTRQLPKPQVITVKTVNNTRNKYSSSNSINSVRSHTPNTLKKDIPSHSVSSPSMQMDTLTRKPVQSIENTDKKVRSSRDSESSGKSITTVDSGLGSSSESDKLRVEIDTEALNIVEGEDQSDIWLREKRSSSNDPEKRKSATKMEVIFNETSYAQMNGKQVTDFLKDSPTQMKESLKEKISTPVTYGMARQKFAPYSRNRFGYGSTVKSPTSPNPMKNIGGGTPPGATKIQNNGVGSFVRSRIAQLEKTPAVKFTQQVTPTRTTSLKKPVIRPTSFEKSPNLVTPIYEKTVELSRPVCRKLEYSEETKNSKLEHKLSSSSLNSTTEDILMVSSVEKEKATPIENKEFIFEAFNNNNNVEVKNEVIINEVNFIPNKMSVSRESLENQECKSLKDEMENEKNTEDTKVKEDDNLVKSNEDSQDVNMSASQSRGHTPRQSPTQLHRLSPCQVPEVSQSREENMQEDKVLSPESEDSFEVLETNEELQEMNEDLQLQEMTQELQSPNLVQANDQTIQENLTDQIQTPSANNHNSPQPPKKTTIPEEPKESSDLPTEVQTNKQTSVTSANTKVNQSIKSIMTSSFESQKSFGNTIMGESIDHSNGSGKCTPTLQSNRGDLDQDFLIDDEISDQPGLTFDDGALGTSFFDEDIFGEDLPPLSPSHTSHKPVPMERSRPSSVCTTSSAGGDDLMLDFDHLDMEDTTKMAYPVEYEEDVLSPDASEIFTEWTAMMAEMGNNSEPMSLECVSHDGGSSDISSSPRRIGPTSKLPRPRSSCSSIGDITASPQRQIPSRAIKTSKQGDLSEVDGGLINLDRTSYHYLCQDVSSVKTKLLQLKKILNNADTINPFDANHRNSLYLSLGANETPGGGLDQDFTSSDLDLTQENVDLKRQVVLLQQQLEEKDRTVRLLQQQLAQALQLSTSTSSNESTSNLQVAHNSSGTTTGPVVTPPSTSPLLNGDSGLDNSIGRNAATQTDRTSHRPSFAMASLSRTGSIDDGLGPTVSSEVEIENDHTDCSSKVRNCQETSKEPSLTNNQSTQSPLHSSNSKSSNSNSSKLSSSLPVRLRSPGSAARESEQMSKSASYSTNPRREPPCTIHRSFNPSSSLLPCASTAPVITH